MQKLYMLKVILTGIQQSNMWECSFCSCWCVIVLKSYHHFTILGVIELLLSSVANFSFYLVIKGCIFFEVQ